ncbi:MAG TPA: cytochrome C biogenesis protein CcmH, partial [Gammaproteobacteria bacterium]|nr:cytochrome C biogenesis protein CcmH [Gammaproteobacteria bacterium]
AAQLRCAVCQSQSVAESDSELAVEMKRVIAEKFDQGASEAEVVDYFVARYGDYILMKPRSDGAGRLLWLAPALILMMVVTVVVLQIRQRSRINPTAEKEFQARELSADEQSRLAALRKRDS